MENLNKSTFALSILIALLAVTGCASKHSEGYDGMLLKDAKGNVYRLEHKIDDLFTVNKVKIEDLKAVIDFSET